MAVQIPHHIHPEVSAQNAFWRGAPGAWRVFHRLAGQKGCRIEEGHLMPDHVHMLISIPPKLAVSSVVGYLKGKSAIHVARHCLKRERNYAGQHLWARGYFVDTVGRDTEKVRRYIQNQEAEDRRFEQLELTDQPQKQNDRKQN